MSSAETLQIIIVEDSDIDFYSLQRALARAGVTRPPLRFCGADDLFRFLAEPPTGAEGGPRIVILDLNLPGVGGLEVLARLRLTPGFDRVPVIILSTSTNPRDIDESYRRGASSYVAKALEYRDFERAVQRLIDFYGRTAMLSESA